MINWPDVINGGFELFGAPLICLSIIKLHKDKMVRGVSWIVAGYFMLWGYWNLFYYPHLGQWCSFIGGCSIVVANTVWLIQMLYYISQEGKMLQPETTAPRLKGVSKSMKGKPKIKNAVYARSRSKRATKGEETQHPLTYPSSVGYQL